jgi:BON domain-containing protein
MSTATPGVRARAEVGRLLRLAPLLLLLLGCNKKASNTSPSNPPPTDTQLSQQVAEQILQDPALKNDNIQVEAKDGVVTLKGEVEAESEKAEATRIAGQVEGVRQVALALTVENFSALESEASSVQPEVPHTKPPQATGRAPQAAIQPQASQSTALHRPSPAPAPSTLTTAAPRPKPPVAGSAAKPPLTSAGMTTKTWNNPIDQYLARKPNPRMPSPLTGNGPVFESDGAQYTIDPRLIVGISGAETSFATGRCHSTPVRATRNAWNWFYCYGSNSCGTDVCVNSPFDSWQSGINTVSKFVQRNYIMKGLTDVRKIQTKYCITGCAHWVPNVEAVMRDMGGDPEKLTLETPVH